MRGQRRDRIDGDKFGATMSTVAIHENLVYAIQLTGFVDCIDLESGKRIWQHDLLSNSWGSPLVADGKVYVPAGDRIDIFDEASGSLLGQMVAGNGQVLSNNVLVTGNLVFASSATGTFAFDRYSSVSLAFAVDDKAATTRTGKIGLRMSRNTGWRATIF